LGLIFHEAWREAMLLEIIVSIGIT
jgi:hypothetical protein